MTNQDHITRVAKDIVDKVGPDEAIRFATALLAKVGRLVGLGVVDSCVILAQADRELDIRQTIRIVGMPGPGAVLQSPGGVPGGDCGHCGEPCAVYQYNGDSVVMHAGRRCPGFQGQFAPGSTKAGDEFAWRNFDDNRTEPTFTKRPTQQIPNKQSVGDDSAQRFALLEMD